MVSPLEETEQAHARRAPDGRLRASEPLPARAAPALPEGLHLVAALPQLALGVGVGGDGAMNPPRAEWECFDIFFGIPEVRELRAGVLNSDAEHVFTNGHCHSFAEALRQLTVAQLIFAFDCPAEGSEDDEVQGHVLVRIAGRYLDARGWVDERLKGPAPNRVFAAQWDLIREIGPEGWLANSRRWLEPRVTDALPFAAALLARLQIPIDTRPGGAGDGEEVCGCTGS